MFLLGLGDKMVWRMHQILFGDLGSPNIGEVDFEIFEGFSDTGVVLERGYLFRM